MDYNSGEVTEVYSAPKDSILGCMSMDKDGDIYFVEGKYKRARPTRTDSAQAIRYINTLSKTLTKAR